jgi:hypothetical protein
MWEVLLDPEFDLELSEFQRGVRIELLAKVELLKQLGPRLGRPHADTLKGSSFTNMKELRFVAEGGAWRAAFAFDPQRNAIILVAGDKSGVSESRFYQRLIEKADRRYRNHLSHMQKGR